MKLITLAVALLVIGVSADVAAASWKPRVGHTVEQVPGSFEKGERPVDVHLWYPADKRGFSRRPRTVYSSALYGVTLLPERWDPLSWVVDAEIAREDAAIERDGKRFPVIVFTHGSENEPIDYAHTLELIAAAGFVVAAPAHVGNTQDDARIDDLNRAADEQVLPCRDGRLWSLTALCSRTNVPLSMADRVTDISAVLDALPDWLGDRVDASRAGVLGHSRGTVAALAAAGGSAPRSDGPLCQPTGELCWPLSPESRVAAVMGLAIGGRRVTDGVDFANVNVPSLLVAGALDATSPPAISESAFALIASTRKYYVEVPGAVHRSFDSTYCDQAQAAGAIVQRATRRGEGERPFLDRHTFEGIVSRVGMSGRATEYCGLDTFTRPADIRPLVTEATGFDFTANTVPTTGLDADTVKYGMSALAATFFGEVLKDGR